MDGDIHPPLHHETGCDPAITETEEKEDDEEGYVVEDRQPGSLIGDVAGPEEGPEDET